MDFKREIVKISDNLYRIEEGFVRWFLIEGSEKAAVIDTGVIGDGIKEVIEELTNKEVILINTHGDGDHTAGNGFFAQYYIGKEDFENCDMASRYPDSKAVFLEDGDIIELGNRPLEIITIPGHTFGSVAIYDKTTKILFAGDTVQDGSIFMFGTKRCPESFGSSLEKLVKRQADFDTIFGSHGTAGLPGDYAKKVLDSWKDVQNGKCTCEEINMHGTDVLSCKAEYCGFFLDRTK